MNEPANFYCIFAVKNIFAYLESRKLEIYGQENSIINHMRFYKATYSLIFVLLPLSRSLIRFSCTYRKSHKVDPTVSNENQIYYQPYHLKYYFNMF